MLVRVDSLHSVTLLLLHAGHIRKSQPAGDVPRCDVLALDTRVIDIHIS